MKYFLMAVIMAGLCGCTLFEVKVNVVSERTALENQVLGTYHSLDRQMLLTSSVRGIDPKGRVKSPPPESGDKKDAIAAMQLIDFYQDDITLFKQWGWAGENNHGYLDLFPMDTQKVDDAQKEAAARYSKDEFTEIIQNVNQARTTVMQRVIDMNENLSQDDMPEIEMIFGKLQRETARQGEKIQTPDGKWQTK